MPENRGFGSMDKDKQREAASKGGQASHDSDQSGQGQKQGSSNSGSEQRGFASMDEDKQREIASKGGKAAHEKGTAHEFTSEEAREAGRKGGESGGRNR